MTNVVLQNVLVNGQSAPRLNAVSVTFKQGELVAILGPNGAGKTTLLQSALGLIANHDGLSTIDAIESANMSAQHRALKIAYLPQVRPLAWPVCVEDTVALGRFSHGVTLGRLKPQDQLAVDRAMNACELQALSKRRTDTLSGGELARVHCARAFAAEAPMLFADEPVAALDPKHQFLIMNMLRNYVAGGGGAVVVLHDPNLAAQFSDRLIWMMDGHIVADGSVADTMTVEHLAKVYGVDARVSQVDQCIQVTLTGIDQKNESARR